MNIDKTLSQLEDQLEKYEETNEPDERLDIKQTIRQQLQAIRQFSDNNKPLTTQQKQTMADIEEILSY